MVSISRGCILSIWSNMNMERGKCDTFPWIHCWSWSYRMNLWNMHFILSTIHSLTSKSLVYLAYYNQSIYIYDLLHLCLLLVWKVINGYESVNMIALYSHFINIPCNDLGDVTFSHSCGPMEREDQRLGWIWIFHKPRHSLQNCIHSNMLPK